MIDGVLEGNLSAAFVDARWYIQGWKGYRCSRKR
jgi:hypothetical protein